ARLSLSAKGSVQTRHQERSAYSFAGYVAKSKNEVAILALYEIVVVATDLAAGKADAYHIVARYTRRRDGMEPELYLACHLQLFLHALLLYALFYQPGVLDLDSRDRGNG